MLITVWVVVATTAVDTAIEKLSLTCMKREKHALITDIMQFPSVETVFIFFVDSLGDMVIIKS